jgi:Flp pilus assembly protein TadG
MRTTTHTYRRRSMRRACWGVVTVEFAICAPILFFFFFAALEFSRVNMIRQSVENAVYEGSRRGIVPGATAADCRAAAQNVLNTVMARNATIDVTPAVIVQDTPEVTVAVAVLLQRKDGAKLHDIAARTIQHEQRPVIRT